MNKSYRLKRLIKEIVKLLTLVTITLFTKWSFAGISVDPVILELTAKENSEMTGAFKVFNTGKNPVRFRIKVEQWYGSSIEPDNWLSFETCVFELAGDGERDIKYKIVPPIDSKGELKCMAFFIADELGENRSNVGIQFGVPIYVVIDKTEKMDVEISNLNVGYANGVLKGEILVNNRSNIHIRPDVELIIKDDKGYIIFSFHIPYRQPVQEKQIRPFTFQEEKTLSKGKYTILVKIDYGALYNKLNDIVSKEAEFIVE